MGSIKVSNRGVSPAQVCFFLRASIIMVHGIHTESSVQVQQGYVLNLFGNCGTAYNLTERRLTESNEK